MLPQQYCLRWKYHHSNLQTMFSQLLDRGCFCDVTLACEGQLIRAHRVVLCACSTFFDTVLTNYASERDPIIIMKDVTFADVKCLIEFMYKGEINVEHANLSTLLKTADDLKIKGLAEVSWREDDETSPPPPTPATEFHSPTRSHDAYGAVYDLQQKQQQQQQQHSQYTHHNHRTLTPPPLEQVGGRSTSPAVLGVVGKSQSRLPILTPIPSSTNSISIVTSSPSTVDHYLGPKRKRGRPPLDDAYDIFNARKLAAHYPGTIDPQMYLESLHYATGTAGAPSEDQQHAAANTVHQPPPPSHSPILSPAAAAAAMAAYQQHLHHHHQQQQQLPSSKQRQRHKHRNHSSIEASPERRDSPAEAEWISSNFEAKNNENARTASAENVNPNNIETDVKTTDCKVEVEEQAISLRKFEKTNGGSKKCEHSAEKPLKVRSSRKNSAEKSDNVLKIEEPKEEDVKVDDQQPFSPIDHRVPQPVEEMQIENEQQSSASEQQDKAATPPLQGVNGTHPHTSTSTSSASPTAASSICRSSSPIAEHKSKNNNLAHAPLPQPTTAPLHHPHFGKYAPEGYLLNEHGMLVTHDFVHATTASIPTGASATVATNGSEQDYGDIKMEDYDAADMRLTTEEMREWQDVIKMDDYLAKGRRPQFWEEPFTRRVLDAIKNKRLEMKKAARILGVSYGTLYGRYREVYGCLKHPNNTFRAPQTSQLTAPPRFDMVWSTANRDGGILTAPLEIGKIRPKDMSELWARPQM